MIGENILLPEKIQKEVGEEKIDFVVQTERAYPTAANVPYIILGSMFVLMPLVSNIISISLNQWVKNNNDKYLVLAISTFFLCVGIGVIIWAGRRFMKKGGIFVATPKKLCRYLDGRVKTMYWKNFTGGMKIYTKKNQKGDIWLDTNFSLDDADSMVCLVGVSDFLNVSSICRQHIEKNNNFSTNAMAIPSSTDLPEDLKIFLGDENLLFAVKSSSKGSKKISGTVSISGIPIKFNRNISPNFSGILIILFGMSFILVPIISGFLELSYVFFPIGLFWTILGVRLIFKPEEYFIGIAMGLIRYGKKISVIKWNKFKNKVQTRGNNEKGTVELEFKAGTSNRQRNFLIISSIPNTLEIADICRNQIKSKDENFGNNI